MRRLLLAGHGILRTALILVVLVLVNGAAEQVNYAADLTPGDRLTLDPQLAELARSVDQKVEITAFFSPGPTRDELAGFFRRLRRENRRIRTRFVDPDLQIDVVNRFGIRYYGTVVLEMGGRREDATSPSPQDLATALLRLQRTGSRRLCFTTGHGERQLDDEGAEGLALLRALLARNGYDPVALPALTGGTVPEDCAAVVLAGPQVSLAEGELAALRASLAGTGRLLWLVDHPSATNVDELAGERGVTVEHGLVAENDPDRRLAANPLLVMVPSSASSNPIVEGLPGATVYPETAALTVPDRQPRDGLFISELARTSPDSYLVRDPEATAFDPARDLKGPLTLAVAADESRQVQDPDGVKVERSRMTILASTDIAANLFIGQLANQLLLIRSLNWLTQAEGLVGIRSNAPDATAMVVTDRRYRTMILANGVAVPLVVLASGAAIWWWRRRRT